MNNNEANALWRVEQTKLWYLREEDGYTVPRMVHSQEVKRDINAKMAANGSWVHHSGTRLYVAAGTAMAANGRIAWHLVHGNRTNFSSVADHREWLEAGEKC